jgi:hypothetical protein
MARANSEENEGGKSSVNWFGLISSILVFAAPFTGAMRFRIAAQDIAAGIAD